MRSFYIILANLIRDGKVTVEVPNLDLDKLRRVLDGEAVECLRRIEAIACDEEMTDKEKVEWIQDFLD